MRERERGQGICRRGRTKIQKEMISRSATCSYITCALLECMRAHLNSIFLGGIDKVYVDLVGSDLGLE